jgi:hypothetical protein
MIWIVALILLAQSVPAFAQDHHGHAQHHDNFYLHLKQPGTGMSCCSGLDCRPIRAFRITPVGVEFQIEGRWHLMPAEKIMEETVPDGTGAHWCGVGERTANPTTYCAVLPRSGS